MTASLELVSPPGCGSEPELASAIASRSERIRIVASSPETRALRIELKEAGSGLTATLSLTQPSGRRSLRTLRAATCEEALEAAALVAAVSLDPTAFSAPAEPEVAAPAPPVTAPAACPPCAEAAPRREGSEPSEPHGFAWSLGLGFEALWAPAPAVMPGVAAGVTLAYERGSVFSPAVRLSFSHFARGGFETAGGTAEFSLDAATLELCPLRAVAGPLWVYPCLLRVTGGELDASGADTLSPRSRGRPWWVVGSSLVALVRPSRTLELTLTLAAGRPLVRDRFRFEPLEFHRVSGVAFGAGAGAGVAFP